MTTCTQNTTWADFLEFAEERTSSAAFENWLAPIRCVEEGEEGVVLEVPNVFVQEYLLENYREDLCAFLPVAPSGEPLIRFVIAKPTPLVRPPSGKIVPGQIPGAKQQVRLNPQYRFETFIEGPANQFVKSAAMGVATRPGRSYNPLFIHGGVGLGKTHLLHSIGHYALEHHKELKVECITTEAFINELVDALRNKTIDKLKRYWRNLDILLVDDIQFLQNRPNFEEEFCNTFEALIHQSKQVVITSDKPPSQLKLSERLVARMEWGLVAGVNVPDLETRVAILLHKAERKGLEIPSRVAFFIAEHIYSNVRQLEGAVNRLSLQTRLLRQEITEELVESTLRELLQRAPKEKISVEVILKSVATIFQVPVRDLKGHSRTKEIVLPRQVAMYLATEMVSESLQLLGLSFGGRTHSTILHARDKIEKKLKEDENLRRRIDMVRRSLEIE
ncbi:MAG: chromosomal replication initiator protein DnaA [Parachlamydiales bacterium]